MTEDRGNIQKGVRCGQKSEVARGTLQVITHQPAAIFPGWLRWPEVFLTSIDATCLSVSPAGNILSLQGE